MTRSTAAPDGMVLLGVNVRKREGAGLAKILAHLAARPSKDEEELAALSMLKRFAREYKMASYSLRHEDE